MMYQKKYVVITLLLAVALISGSCAALQKRLDRSGIRDIADEIMENFQPGSPEELQQFISSLSLKKGTTPVKYIVPEISPRSRWHLKHPTGKPLIHEEVVFSSRIERYNRKDRARFFLYRQGSLRGRKVILWVPGMGVSDFAFRFIKNFFKQELQRDYDILFYMPPFHMDRRLPGKGNGSGFFTSDMKQNITVILESVRELRTAMTWLRKKEVKSIGGWGGSIGAAMLLLAGRFEKLDHCCVMIPIIDWNTVIVSNIEMKRVMGAYAKRGFSRELIASSWKLINPRNYTIPVPAERMHVMYARHDQLTPPAVIRAWASREGIKNLVEYNRSHATILVGKKLYHDCGAFLDAMTE